MSWRERVDSYNENRKTEKFCQYHFGRDMTLIRAKNEGTVYATEAISPAEKGVKVKCRCGEEVTLKLSPSALTSFEKTYSEYLQYGLIKTNGGYWYLVGLKDENEVKDFKSNF